MNTTTPTLNIDKSNWKKYRFGDVTIQTKEVVDIENTTLDRYIAGEHMDSEDLHIRRWGIVLLSVGRPEYQKQYRTIAQQYGLVYIYQEKTLPSKNTEAACQKLKDTLAPYNRIIIAYNIDRKASPSIGSNSNARFA